MFKVSKLVYSKCVLSFSVHSVLQFQFIRMSHKFAANLSFMFTEHSQLSERYRAAKEAGFQYVECGFPYVEPLETIKKAKQEAGVEQVLINAWPGNISDGDLGIAALPSRKAEFAKRMETTIEYAKALDCKRVHIMAGLKPKFEDVTMEEVFLDNLQMAADRLDKEGIMALIEPINSRISLPNYFLTDIHQAVKYIKKVNHPNLKLQVNNIKVLAPIRTLYGTKHEHIRKHMKKYVDLFHVQVMDGNLTSNLKQYMPHIGHIQIAQVPDRGEPDSNGEINYGYIFKLLKDVGYDGYIGLEYKPRGSTGEGLRWMEEYGLSL